MNSDIYVNDSSYHILSLLGHGKGGYSYLAVGPIGCVVLKQLHHEPCDYYRFGDKFAAELTDYERLCVAGIRIPLLLDADKEQEIIIKQYIEGPTIMELLKLKADVSCYLDQVKEMADKAHRCNLNIDYFPTNFVVQNQLIYYVDYECNEYMEQWDFEHWGYKYWQNSPELQEYLQSRQ